MTTTKKLIWLLMVGLVFSNCTKNKDITHPDFDYQTVYFGTQYPVRTLELGEDLFVDNSLDNEKKVEIKATLAGTRDNKKNVAIGVQVDNSLLDRLYFSNTGAKILPMPSNYYTMASNTINIHPGNILGGVQVQLTDAFFADPLSLVNTYAIPLKMVSVQNADSILAGKDFVLYVVKYVNTWHGNYLRRGQDEVTYQGETTPVTITRRAEYRERDEVNKLTTRSLSQLEFPVPLKDKNGVNITVTLLLNFDDNGNCTITSGTAGVTASGTGSFVKRGDKNSWGNQDRDVLYLNYNISMSQLTATTKDTLVMRDRAVAPEYFTPIVQ
ncbi:hypothetical protein PIECOFPK_00704 [Mycovorax composti]|jgi:hypothetical protein|uniref:Adhesin n=2 Tax=Chitinophagaceae TaxID=563835 RepID=A0ABZ2EHM7_9BACT